VSLAEPVSKHVPRYVVAKAPRVGGPPIPDDEHPLVVREQDILAPFVIRAYLAEYRTRAVPAPDPAVIVELTEHLRHVIEWQANHPQLVKWADR
jgi:hypothetical protein